MDKRSPQELLSFACNLPTDRTNTIRTDAIVRIYLALNDLFCTQYTDGHAVRKKILDRIDTLCKIRDSCSIGGLRRMCRFKKETTAILYGTKDEHCSRICRKLLDDRVRRSAPAKELDVLQCIVYELGDIPTGNTDRFNDTALRAYAYCQARRQSPRQTTVGELVRLGGWYDLLCNEGLFPCEPEVRNHIGKSFASFAETAKPYSDEWYIASICAAVHRCFVLTDELPGEINPVA